MGVNMQALQERIRPSADLRNHYNEISKQCRENKEAVIITVNGRGDTVSLGYEEYNRLKEKVQGELLSKNKISQEEYNQVFSLNARRKQTGYSSRLTK